MKHLIDLNDLDCGKVKELLRQLELNRQGKAYWDYLNQIDMKPSKEFKVQVMYVLANAHARDEAQKRVIEVIDKWANDGEHAYCKICGTREGKAFEKYGKDACDICYEEVGEAEVCSKCGDKTYEGDYLGVYVVTEKGEAYGYGKRRENFASGDLMSCEMDDLLNEGMIEDGVDEFVCERCLDRM